MLALSLRYLIVHRWQSFGVLQVDFFSLCLEAMDFYYHPLTYSLDRSSAYSSFYIFIFFTFISLLLSRLLFFLRWSESEAFVWIEHENCLYAQQIAFCLFGPFITIFVQFRFYHLVQPFNSMAVLSLSFPRFFSTMYIDQSRERAQYYCILV